MFEASFRIPGVAGNPFAAQIWAEVVTPSGARFWRPAFFDGDGVWRLRVTPVEPGHHHFELFVGPAGHRVPARTAELTTADFDVNGPASAGFVRRAGDRVQAFVLDDGSPFFPLGHNLAWAKPEEYERIFAKMGAAGENWSRVWMAHWSGQNLDWNPRRPVPLGTLDLDVARTWDLIVRAAERNGISFQLVLQHHGQYSTTTNPNWNDNPYAKKNGGFLDRPEDFFTDARAKELTERKLRYAVARWGQSTAIMAWELFNEVEWTDAYKDGRISDVAAWHQTMAEYLRSIDAYRHLVTTSSVPASSPICASVDYFQPHRYAVNLVEAISRYGVTTASLDRPIFFGEMGYQSVLPGLHPDPRAVHAALWAGLMADGAGAAQYWYWESVERQDLYADFGAAARFASAAGFATRAMQTRAVTTRGEMLDRVVLVPESSWIKGSLTDFELHDDGRPVEDVERLPVYLHGDAAKVKEGYAHGVTFRLAPKHDVEFSLHIDEIAKAGAAVEIRIDGGVAGKRVWPASERDQRVDEVLTAKIPAGKRILHVGGTGTDWAHVTSYEFDGYREPVLRALGRVSAARDAVALWIYSIRALRDPDAKPTGGTVTLSGVAPGSYSVAWWDTLAGKPTARAEVEVGEDGQLTIDTPAVALDAAAIVTQRR